MSSLTIKILCVVAIAAFNFLPISAGPVEDPDNCTRVASEVAGFTRCDCGTSKYYKSINNANLNGARSDCRDRLGGAPVEIETEAELNLIKKWLDDDGDSAGEFWTGAACDIDRACYAWPSTNYPFENWINWAPGHPTTPTVGCDLYGVTLFYRGYGSSIQFKTKANSANARYICESTA